MIYKIFGTFFCVFLFMPNHLQAQKNNYKNTVAQIERLLFLPDTAIYDGEKVNAINMFGNGNVELISAESGDTTRFNVHLLHVVHLDEDTSYNHYGLHLSGQSLSLFLDPPMMQVGMNMDGEVFPEAETIAIYKFDLASEQQVKELADSLIRFRKLTKPDDID